LTFIGSEREAGLGALSPLRSGGAGVHPLKFAAADDRLGGGRIFGLLKSPTTMSLATGLALRIASTFSRRSFAYFQAHFRLIALGHGAFGFQMGAEEREALSRIHRDVLFE
jgi:hypothetical protein